METTSLTKELLQSIESEVNLWAQECGSITDGYDYETKFIARVRTINRILLEKSVEMKSKTRDKKNSRPALGQ